MRVLLVSQAEWSHAAGMVPVGWGLRSAGHEVLFATQPELASELVAAGLPVTAVGRDHRVGEVLTRTPRHRRDADLVSHCLADDIDFETRVWTAGYLVQWWLGLVNDPMLPDLVRLCRKWRPDLVVWETTTLAGAVAARSIGARHMRFNWSVDLLGTMRGLFVQERDKQPPDERRDPMADWLTRGAEWAGCDFDEELTTGQATITQLPASLRSSDPAGIRYLPMRYVPYNGPQLVPPWVLEKPQRPRVAVCLGSSAIVRFGRYACSASDLLAGLGELDVEVVALLAESAHEGLGTLPDNVRLETFVPLDALLPTCTAIVNHGGPGTLSTAAAHGVPQLVVPAEFDAPMLGSGIAAAGAGLDLVAADAQPETVRDYVARLISEPGFAEGAGRLRDEIRAMPDPYELGRSITTEPVPGTLSPATSSPLEVAL